ncbi:MAG: ornithine carbamoyltransferase [Actinomycetota bacterium]|nr:ornithine carbamoyltransferase [Actinomycetota bacterium]
MRHLLDVDDLSRAEMMDILALAALTDPPPVLSGRGAALIFEKPSNRTRNATEMAVFSLGGHPISIQGSEIGLGVREPVTDVVRVLALYHAVVGGRVNDHRLLEAMAAVDVVPVVNLLSDVAHPCQALADLVTLQQVWGSFEGRRVAWVGDGNNVARSLLLAAATVGTDVSVACPPGHELDPVAVDGARAQGVDVCVTADPAEAVAGADAVCTDVWVSMGQEAESAARLDAFAGYQVDDALMGRAAPGAVFLHCLPAHRGLEVAASVIDGPASVVWAQAANRMHAVRGLLLWLVADAPATSDASAVSVRP